MKDDWQPTREPFNVILQQFPQKFTTGDGDTITIDSWKFNGFTEI